MLKSRGLEQMWKGPFLEPPALQIQVTVVVQLSANVCQYVTVTDRALELYSGRRHRPRTCWRVRCRSSDHRWSVWNRCCSGCGACRSRSGLPRWCYKQNTNRRKLIRNTAGNYSQVQHLALDLRLCDRCQNRQVRSLHFACRHHSAASAWRRAAGSLCSDG